MSRVKLTAVKRGENHMNLMNEILKKRKYMLAMSFLVIIALLLPMVSLAQPSTQGIDYVKRFTVAFSTDDLQFSSFQEYDIITISDGFIYGDIGEPGLPGLAVRVALPHDMKVTDVHLLSFTTEEIPGTYALLPMQPPHTLAQSDLDSVFVSPNSLIYQSSNDLPSSVVSYGYQTDLVGQPICEVNIFPVHYLPKNQCLTLYTSVTFELIGTKGYHCGDYLPRESKRYDELSSTLQEMVINPEDVQLQTTDEPQTMGVEPGEYDYVIITQSSWMDDFQPLADWKTKKGVPAIVVDRDWIYSEYSGSNQQKIRAFVHDAYYTWNAHNFLLGGDTNVIPYYSKYVAGYSVPTDTYYADFDDDWTVEVNVGRAPVRVTGEWGIETFIDKIISYETNPPMTGYATTAFFMGFDLYNYGSNEGQSCKEYIKNHYLPGDWTYEREYDSESGGHKSDVLTYLNEGYHLVNHIDHAGDNFMGTGYTNHYQGIDTADAKSRSNGDRQSILYSIGCHACEYTVYECIAEGFVRNPNGGGIAFIGNSHYGWYSPYYGNYYSLRFDRYFFRSLFDQNHYILGECFSDHKNDVSLSDDTYKFIFTALNLMGDPELPLWTENPQTLSVTHPETLPLGQSVVIVEVTDGDTPVIDATVCLWKDDEVYLVDQTSANGIALFLVDPSTEGALSVTVTKHNYLTYQGEINIIASIPGDINSDGVVDQSDLGILLAAWDSRPGDQHWNPDADLDGDDWVNQSDLGILLSHWGEGS